LNKKYTALYSGLKPIICIILTPIVKYNDGINSFNETKHCLNDSILFNNYEAVHLINNENLLKPENVKQVELNEYVKTGTTTFAI